MNGEYAILIVLLLAVLAQVSYLVYVTARANVRSKNTAMYVDTSVLMDGRILPIAETGFITADLVIPRSVIGELQLLADGGDNDKRARARYGLDIAQKLRASDAVNVRILQDNDLRGGVDDRLLALAKKYGGMVCTIDYNLNKVAQVEGIAVVNVNELAKNIRLAYLPGDTKKLELVQKGQDNHQGVGYLEDGTMVVVENASKYIGRVIEVEFIRALQTDAGRMMFAKVKTAARTKQQDAFDAKKQLTDTATKKTKTAAGRSPVKSTAVKTTARQATAKSATAKVTATKRAAQQSQSVTTAKKSEPKANAVKKPATRTVAKKPARRKQTNEDRLIDLVQNQ